MNTLTLTKLSHRVAVYVPGTNGLDTAANTEDINEVLEHTARKLCEYFGGATVTDGNGYYTADNGALVCEPVKIVYAFCDGLGDSETDNVVALAHYIKLYLHQECVAIELDNALLLV